MELDFHKLWVWLTSSQQKLLLLLLLSPLFCRCKHPTFTNTNSLAKSLHHHFSFASPETSDHVPGQGSLDHGLSQHGEADQLVQTDGADLQRFQRQANGAGAMRKVIHERMPSRISFVDSSGSHQAVSFHQDVEQDVAQLRSHNQLATQAFQQVQGVPQMTIGDIRVTPGMADQVDM